MFWLIFGLFLVGPILAIPFAMAAAKRAPSPEPVMEEMIGFEFVNAGSDHQIENEQEFVEQALGIR